MNNINIPFIASFMFFLGCISFFISIVKGDKINKGFLIGIIFFTVGSILYMYESLITNL